MKILAKQILCNKPGSRVTRLDITSPDIAAAARPGQFVALMVVEDGERIPLTVVDKDDVTGTIALIFQEVGLTTRLLGKLEKGDLLHALVGPLGHATEIAGHKNVILVGGGVGIAEICPVAKAFKKAGARVTAILGARSKDLLIMEKEMKDTCDEVLITTDDGSCGRKGFVTDALKQLLETRNQSTENRLQRTDYDLIYAVGPIPMMKNVAAATKESKIKTVVSLNALMVDATGMCGCCRVTIGGKVKFSCVDGPEFDAHAVDWDELAKRNNIYAEKEKHICKLA
jgi:ferredoxin/flavodoxin---NADP+ reductase